MRKLAIRTTVWASKKVMWNNTKYHHSSILNIKLKIIVKRKKIYRITHFINQLKIKKVKKTQFTYNKKNAKIKNLKFQVGNVKKKKEFQKIIRIPKQKKSRKAKVNNRSS